MKKQLIVKQNNHIGVTIICYSYNHEKYIERALDSFICQVTNFPFEIIVHDDSSTDSTQRIIERYAKKYPNLIIPILQKTNQFSLKKNITKEFILPFVRGEYVATCEGDDYWTNTNKLQNQYDALKRNKDCFFAVHKTTEVSENGTETSFTYPSFFLESGYLTSTDFLTFCLGNYSFHTSSYFFVASKWKKLQEDWDSISFAKVCPVGDIPTDLYFGLSGQVYYNEQTMSCYRRGNIESYTYKQLEGDFVSKRIEYNSKMIETFLLFNDYSNHAYENECKKRIAGYLFGNCILRKKSKELLFGNSSSFCRFLTGKNRIALLIGIFFPSLIRKIYIKRIVEQSKRHFIVG